MSYSEAITKEDLKNILNEVLPSTAVDYVTEQGTSGIWQYRKWASGRAECWGQSRKTRSASNTQFTDSLPFTLDASKHINIQASGAATGNTNAYARYTNAGASSIDVYVYATSGTEVWANIYVCGILA